MFTSMGLDLSANASGVVLLEANGTKVQNRLQ